MQYQITNLFWCSSFSLADIGYWPSQMPNLLEGLDVEVFVEENIQ